MADTIKLGNIDISAFKVGSADCKVYLGSVKLYPQTASSYKLQATYSDSSTYDLSCDSSTSLVQSEVRSGSSPYSAMTSAVVGDCVTSIGTDTFNSCSSLSSITISDGVSNIGSFAFAKCSNLKEIEIPSGVTTIARSTFNQCISLSAITIPNSITTISNASFYECVSLNEINLSSNITSIGSETFKNCTNLISVTINATTPPALGSNSFDYTNDCPIYVPSSAVGDYKAASGWSTYASRIQAIPNS